MALVDLVGINSTPASVGVRALRGERLTLSEFDSTGFLSLIFTSVLFRNFSRE
jgi:hypothetical protein